ncbi:MAG: collagen-like protein [Flavobacteriales bacterium]|nr:collagen-like protein [Flavobacteriales bacterium]
MMRILQTMLALLVAVTGIGQTPQGVNYQAALRDDEGVLLMNQAGTFRVSILEDSMNGPTAYQEEHNVVSNELGLVNFVIGEGAESIGTFDAISWGDHTFFARIELDLGQGFVLLGEQQLMSVPYALHAETATLALNAPPGAEGPQGIPGEPGMDGATILSGDTAPNDEDGADGDVYIDSSTGMYYYKINSSWELQGSLLGPAGPQGEPGLNGAEGAPGPQGEQGEQGETGMAGPPGPEGPQGPQGLTGLVDGDCEHLATNNGKIVLYTPEYAYGYGQNSFPSYTWSTQQLSGTVQGAVANDSSIVVYTDTHAYAFGNNSFPSSTWFVQTLSSPVIDAVVTSGMIVLVTSDLLYGFGKLSTGSNTWVAQATGSTPIGWDRAGHSIVVFTSSTAYGFGTNSSGTTVWTANSITGTPGALIGTR